MTFNLAFALAAQASARASFVLALQRAAAVGIRSVAARRVLRIHSHVQLATVVRRSARRRGSARRVPPTDARYGCEEDMDYRFFRIKNSRYVSVAIVYRWTGQWVASGKGRGTYRCTAARGEGVLHHCKREV